MNRHCGFFALALAAALYFANEAMRMLLGYGSNEHEWVFVGVAIAAGSVAFVQLCRMLGCGLKVDEVGRFLTAAPAALFLGGTVLAIAGFFITGSPG
ncbi:hypothetical protein KC727_01820 [Candidatus Kaiserbacteria bacterium]|nr:hypothetical protein [Candidatus Kaiserbacteria bacterium]